MNIQIIGTKKDNNTKKALRYFKERNIKFHFLDLGERRLSEGELSNILRKIDPEDLIDETSASFRKRGFEYMEYDPEEEILEDNSLMKIPVLRSGSDVCTGYAPEIWDEWIKRNK